MDRSVASRSPGALQALALGASGGLARAAALPLIAGTAAGAVGGALLAGQRTAGGGNPYALPGLAAGLAVPVLILLAAALLYRGLSAALAAAAPWRALAGRGASPAQLLLAAAGLPAAAALGCGLVLPLFAGLLVFALRLVSPVQGLGAVLGGAWLGGIAAALVLAATAFGAARTPVAAADWHFRSQDAPPRPFWQRYGLDLVLAVASAALAIVAGQAIVTSLSVTAVAPSLTPTALNGFGVQAAAAPAAAGAPHFILQPLVYLGAAGLIWGCALVAVRLAALAAGMLESRLSEAALHIRLALRAASRGRGAFWPIVAGGLAAGAVVFFASGGPTVASSAAALRASSVGADLRLVETFPAPCGADCGGNFRFFRRLQAPDISTPNQNLAGTTAYAGMVLGQDELTTGVSGQVPITLVGITSKSFDSVARWAPGQASRGRADADRLQTGGVVVSSYVAATLGVHRGDTIQSGMLGEVRVLDVLPAWPGVPPADPDWVAVDWSLMQGPYQQSGAGWKPDGFAAVALFRLAPGTTVLDVEEALSRQPLTFSDATSVGDSRTGPGALPAILWPLIVVALVLGAALLRVPPADPRALPEGDAAVILAAGEAPVRAAALLARAGGAFGALVGALAGWGAAALYWPALRFGAPLVGGATLRVPPLGLYVAVLCLLALAAVLWDVRSWPAETADPVLAARLEALAAARPEPEPEAVPAGGAAAQPAAQAPAAARSQASAWSVFKGVALPAAKRLGHHWPRLLGLGAGLLLAACVAATVPLYVSGSLTRVLHAGLGPVNQRPAGATLMRYLPPPGQGPSDADLAKLAGVAGGVGRSLGLPTSPLVTYQTTASGEVTALPTAGLPAPTVPYVGSMTIDSLTDLAPHVQVTQGQLYSEQATGTDGVIDAVADESAFSGEQLQLGRLYSFSAGPGLPSVTVKLIGEISQVDPTGPYWPYRYYHSDFLVAPAALTALLQSGTVAMDETAYYTTLDLSHLDAEQVPALLSSMAGLGQRVAATTPGASLDVSPYKTLAAFVQRSETLQALLRLVSIPVLALALYFVAITASLIVSAEEAEIAVFVSRGATTAHILTLYIVEWLVLAIPVAIIAPFPAALFARAMGAASGFLHFVPSTPLPVLLVKNDFIYAAVAAGLGVVTAMVPVIASLSRSIVTAKLRRSRTTEQPLWQRAYLDFAALAAMAVLWLVFRHVSLQSGQGAAAIAADPALYLLPAAFLIVSGLLVVRLVGWGLSALDRLIGPWAAPGLVMPLRRIGRLPAQFAPVLLLLCFTAALGSYSAAAARTMDNNLTAAVNYQVGAPVRLDEVSPCVTMNPEIGACLQYDPAPLVNGVRPMPPFALHAAASGIAASSEILVEQANATGAVGSTPISLILVDPATFENVGWWMDGLNPLPLDRYIAAWQANPKAVFVSPDLVKAGQLKTSGPLSVADATSGQAAPFVISGSVERWPGAQVSGAFAVADIDYAESALGIIEAERIALVRLAPGASLDDAENTLATRGIFANTQDIAAPEAAAALATPEWAGQTGMLTVGFLVALAVTIAGYLLYASLLLRAQLSQLGLLRAVGLPWSQLVGSVAIEQGLLLLAGAAAGTAAGLAAAALFLPLFRPAFTGPSAPPFVAAGPGGALGQVGLVMLALLVVALLALLALLRRMHIGETVKLEN